MGFVLEGVSRLDEAAANWTGGRPADEIIEILKQEADRVEAKAKDDDELARRGAKSKKVTTDEELEQMQLAKSVQNGFTNAVAKLTSEKRNTALPPMLLESLDYIFKEVMSDAKLPKGTHVYEIAFDEKSQEWTRLMDDYKAKALQEVQRYHTNANVLTASDIEELVERVELSLSRTDRPFLPFVTQGVVVLFQQLCLSCRDGILEVSLSSPSCCSEHTATWNVRSSSPGFVRKTGSGTVP